MASLKFIFSIYIKFIFYIKYFQIIDGYSDINYNNLLLHSVNGYDNNIINNNQQQISFDPYFDGILDVIYELYTQEHPDEPQIIRSADYSLSASTYKPNAPTRIFIHDWNSNRHMFPEYAKAYLKSQNINFIVVNWLSGSQSEYIKARVRVVKIAQGLANLINYLLTNDMLNTYDFIIIGHGIGAHIAGVTARIVNFKVPFIIGLDPSLLYFNNNSTVDKLYKTDANYVEIMHTNAGINGYSLPIGHADFYPNGGSHQPGCENEIDGICSHHRAQELFLESINQINPFWSTKCVSYDELIIGICTPIGAYGIMGQLLNFLGYANGIYYLQTNAAYPFAISSPI